MTKYVAGVVVAAAASLGVSAASGRGAAQTVWDGVYTEAQARDGQALYMAHCASCHGDTLAGVETAPALVGVSFSATWDGVPLADLFERMRTSMPPGKPGVVTRQGYADILAFIVQRSGMPAGTTTLASERAALLRIRFVSYRP